MLLKIIVPLDKAGIVHSEEKIDETIVKQSKKTY